MLEHIADDRAALQQLRTRLAPTGRLYIYVPAYPVLFSSLDKKVGHYRRYRKQALVRQLAELGFTIERARYVDTLGFWTALIYRLLRVKGGAIKRGPLLFFDRVLFPLNTLFDPLFGWWFGKNLEVVARRS